MTAIPTTFDALFQKWATVRNVPGPFLKSLTWHESRFKPDAKPIDKSGKLLSSAIGFGQILNATRLEYNKAAPALGEPPVPTQDALTDPDTNMRVASWLVKRISQEYKDTGIAALNEQWQSPVYAGLVALGYVAGWSKVQGVANIATRLFRNDFRGDITPAIVREYAMRWYPESKIYNTGKGYMSDPALLTHVEKIARDYAALIAAPPPVPGTPAPPRPPVASKPPAVEPTRKAGIPWWGWALGIGGGLIALSKRRASRK